MGVGYSTAGSDFNAIVCLTKAATRGDETAMFYLGNSYGGRDFYNIDTKRNWLTLAIARAKETGNQDILTRATAELAFESPEARKARQDAFDYYLKHLETGNRIPQPDPYEVRCMMKQGPC